MDGPPWTRPRVAGAHQDHNQLRAGDPEVPACGLPVLTNEVTGAGLKVGACARPTQTPWGGRLRGLPAGPGQAPGEGQAEGREGFLLCAGCRSGQAGQRSGGLAQDGPART